MLAPPESPVLRCGLRIVKIGAASTKKGRRIASFVIPGDPTGGNVQVLVHHLEENVLIDIARRKGQTAQVQLARSISSQIKSPKLPLVRMDAGVIVVRAIDQVAGALTNKVGGTHRVSQHMSAEQQSFLGLKGLAFGDEGGQTIGPVGFGT